MSTQKKGQPKMQRMGLLLRNRKQRSATTILALMLLFMGACFPGAPTCDVAAIDLPYTYNTTCSQVANTKEGPFVWKLPAGNHTQRQVETMLTAQLSDQGLEVEDVVLRWTPATCTADNEPGSTPRIPAGIVRLVLTPTPSTDTGVSVLLVCTPTAQKDSTDLKRNFLLACRRGPSKSIACTFQLKLVL